MTGQVLRNNFDLNDKYTLIDGKVVLSGIQALVRLLIDQHRADLIAGLTIQIGSTMIDTSIKSKLKKLEKNMVEA